MEIIIYAALGPSGEERALARRLLAEALARERGLTGLPAIAAGANGKPFFPDRPDLQFNLSHSHGAAVCALHHLPIGVDVERLRPAPGGCHGGWTTGIFSACGRRRRPPSSAGALPCTPCSPPWNRIPSATVWRNCCPAGSSPCVPRRTGLSGRSESDGSLFPAKLHYVNYSIHKSLY